MRPNTSPENPSPSDDSGSERDSSSPAESSSQDRVERFDVPPESAGERLDRFLLTHFPELSRSVLKRYVTEGRVLLAGSTAKPSTALRAGQSIEVRVPPPPPPFPIPQDLPLEVIYQDDAILVLNKSPDMVVHPSPGVTEGGTIVNALLNHTDELSREGGDFRPGIVHRLDRETSGILVVARTDAAHRIVAAQFKAREVHKEYLALCHGYPAEPSGRVDLPLGRSLTQRKKMAVRCDSAGKPSVTDWKVVRRLGSFTWFHCFPETGRTHQIRLHLKAIGHPILCDQLYGREKSLLRSTVLGQRPTAGEEPILTRHALHARRLELTHPTTGQLIAFEAELPADLAGLWDEATPITNS